MFQLTNIINNTYKYFKLITVGIIVFQLNNTQSYSYQTDKKINEIIKKVLETDQKNKSYQAEINIYSKGYYEKGIKTLTEKETRISGLLTFKKPAKVLFKVDQSLDPMAIGSTLLYTGGEKVQVRASGILGLFKVSFRIDDPMFSNARNHKFSFDGLKNLRSGILKADVLGKILRNGKDSFILRVESVIKADPEITHEIYFVDIETYRVLAIEMYVNNNMVSQYSIKNIKANIVKNDNEVFKL